MSHRDFGTLHKYLDSQEKNYETIVSQQDKPLSSSELVLQQEIGRQDEDAILRESIDSGFLRGDFLLDHNEDYSFGMNANQFKLVNKPVVHLNGWVMPLEYTNTSNDGENVITVDAPPTSSGEQGVDFVWLEAWRTLIQSDPDSTNKPASDQVYRHGNVLSPSGTWLNDEMKDNPISSQTGNETSIRVQIQYRIRSARLNTDGNRDGFSDDNVHPQGPNSSQNTNFTYGFAPSSSKVDSNDRGLWLAGDEIGTGNEFPGTADGFIYATPICLVYRRNSGGFDEANNGNGGLNEVESATSSDRPDGLFADQIVYEDVQDLRKAVSLEGEDWERVHERNINDLLDNDMRTWATNSAHTQWYVGGNNDTSGNSLFMADDIVEDSLDRSHGNTIRNPDGICRVFSDRARPEKYVKIYHTEVDWVSGDTFTLDLTSTGMDVENELPDGARISDVHEVRLDDTDGSNGYLKVPIQSVSGLGTRNATITIGTPPTTSSENIWIVWEVLYPPGGGLTRHPEETPSNFKAHFTPSTEFENIIGTGVSSSSDVAQYADIYYEFPHREVKVEIRQSSALTRTVYARDGSSVVIPEYPYLDGQDPNNTITVTEGGSTKSIIETEKNGRVLHVDPTFSSSDAQVDVTYTPERPLPKNTNTTIYYRSPAISAIPKEFLPSTLNVQPVYLPDSLYACISGTGSQGESFPWVSPSSQIPVNYQASYEGEEELDAPPEISIDDFNADTGALKLQLMVPLSNVSELTLKDPINSENPSGTPEGNEESVDHYANTEDNTYKPAIIAQSLSSRIEHKTFYPILAKLKEDTEFAKRGTVVMIVFSQYSDYYNSTKIDAEENKIVFDNENSCIGVYKIKGNFLAD